MNRVFRITTPILFFLAAIAVRILSWHSVFQRGGVYPNGNDAYYHFRRIRYSIDNFQPGSRKLDLKLSMSIAAASTSSKSEKNQTPESVRQTGASARRRANTS